jgi:hypothetical protein
MKMQLRLPLEPQIPAIVRFMTSRGVLALGFGGETMEIPNPETASAGQLPPPLAPVMDGQNAFARENTRLAIPPRRTRSSACHLIV